MVVLLLAVACGGEDVHAQRPVLSRASVDAGPAPPLPKMPAIPCARLLGRSRADVRKALGKPVRRAERSDYFTVAGGYVLEIMYDDSKDAGGFILKHHEVDFFAQGNKWIDWCGLRDAKTKGVRDGSGTQRTGVAVFGEYKREIARVDIVREEFSVRRTGIDPNVSGGSL